MCIYWNGDDLKKLNINDWNKGSYTVEASLLLPFIFFILLYFICFAFYLHDKEVITNVAYEIALVGSGGGFIEKSSFRSYSKEELLAYGNNRISKVLISTKIKNIIVEKKEGEVIVSIFGEYLNPLFNGFGISILADNEIKIKQAVKIQESPDYVRKNQVVVERIKKLWE